MVAMVGPRAMASQPLLWLDAGEALHQTTGDAPFRRRLWEVLESCRAIEEKHEGVHHGSRCWKVPLLFSSQGGLTTKAKMWLRVVEEVVQEQHPGAIYCEHCNCAGWSAHPVSMRRYHFIVPHSEEEWAKLNRGGNAGGRHAIGGERRGRSRGMGTTERNTSGEERDTPLSSQRHLLHGLLHSNGYGHLVRLNGREGGSEKLTGAMLMQFWDRLCVAVHARQVTVQDVARKRGMDLRLLHCLAHGRTWYGEWGYAFLRGGFGTTFEQWKQAVKHLLEITLAELRSEFESDAAAVACIRKLTNIYAGEAGRGGKVHTLSGLVRKMLEARKKIGAAAAAAQKESIHQKDSKAKDERRSSTASTTPTPTPPEKKKSTTTRVVCENGKGGGATTKSFSLKPDGKLEPFSIPKDCRWSDRRVELAVQAIVLGLKRAKTWVPRQEVRDLARSHIGDTGLLDYVLKMVSNRVVENFLVKRDFNNKTRVLEYRAVPVSSTTAAERAECCAQSKKGAHFAEREESLSHSTYKRKRRPCNGEVTSEQVKPRGNVTVAVGDVVCGGGGGAVGSAERAVDAHLAELYGILKRNLVKPASKSGQGPGFMGSSTRPQRPRDGKTASAIQTVLDCKLFVKDYTSAIPAQQMKVVARSPLKAKIIDAVTPWRFSSQPSRSRGILRVYAQLITDEEECLRSPSKPTVRRLVCKPPPELLYLPSNATIGDLKDACMNAYSELYEAFSKFQPTGFVGDGIDGKSFKDNQPLGQVAPGTLFKIVGTGAEVNGPWNRQGGNAEWVVNCACGIVDDDGERYLSCDICEVWEHTRCAGIGDSDPVPAQWVCLTCRRDKRRRK